MAGCLYYIVRVPLPSSADYLEIELSPEDRAEIEKELNVATGTLKINNWESERSEEVQFRWYLGFAILGLGVAIFFYGLHVTHDPVDALKILISGPVYYSLALRD